MSKSNKCRRKIEIVGLITSIPYQTAIKGATEVASYYPRHFYKPKCRGMLEFDWDEHLTKQRRIINDADGRRYFARSHRMQGLFDVYRLYTKFGGQLWALLRPVAVYINNVFIGSDQDFVKFVNKSFVYSLPINTFYEKAMIDDYTRYLVKSERLYVFLDINIDGKHIGNLIFQLYSDLLPATCYNFRCLCTGDEKKELCYKGTQIHRIAKMGWIQGGDNENITGGGGKSIYGAPFPDESYCISHNRRGVLSMANPGKHANGSQFFVTLQPTVWMDYYYVGFGQLVEGVEVLKAIEAVEERYEEPKKVIKIIDCGIVYEPTSKEYRRKMRPYESEEMRRMRMEELERKKKEKEEKERMESEEEKALLKEPRLAEEVLDPRELDSEMYVDRYIAGFYYLFNALPLPKEPTEAEVIVESITEELINNVVTHIGRYIMDIVLRRVHGSGTSLDEETDEEMIRRIVSDIITRATIHLEVDAATELVDEIIAKAMETIYNMYNERSAMEEGGVPLAAIEGGEGEVFEGEGAQGETEVGVDDVQHEMEGNVDGAQEEGAIAVSASHEVVGDSQPPEETNVEEGVPEDHPAEQETMGDAEAAEPPPDDAPPEVPVEAEPPPDDAPPEAPVEAEPPPSDAPPEEAPVEKVEEPEPSNPPDEAGESPPVTEE